MTTISPREIGIHPLLSGGSRSRAISSWAEAHFGLISRRKLRDLGLTDAQIDWRAEVGWLVNAGNGIFFVGHRSSVVGQREALALAQAGTGAALAGASAAAWRGMVDRPRGPVHVAVPHSRADNDLDDVVRHSPVIEPGEIETVRGLACVIPERAVMDLPGPQLRQALQWLLRNGRAVEPIVERMRGRRGAIAFRAEVEQLIPQMAHTMSELEDRFLRLCRRHGIPIPVVNGLLAGGDLIDVSWPDSRVVIELDGRRWHEHRDREDRARDQRRLLEGRVSLRLGWLDVTRDHAATARTVIDARNRW